MRGGRIRPPRYGIDTIPQLQEDMTRARVEVAFTLAGHELTASQRAALDSLYRNYYRDGETRSSRLALYQATLEPCMTEDQTKIVRNVILFITSGNCWKDLEATQCMRDRVLRAVADFDREGKFTNEQIGFGVKGQKGPFTNKHVKIVRTRQEDPLDFKNRDAIAGRMDRNGVYVVAFYPSPKECRPPIITIGSECLKLKPESATWQPHRAMRQRFIDLSPGLQYAEQHRTLMRTLQHHAQADVPDAGASAAREQQSRHVIVLQPVRAASQDQSESTSEDHGTSEAFLDCDSCAPETRQLALRGAALLRRPKWREWVTKESLHATKFCDRARVVLAVDLAHGAKVRVLDDCSGLGWPNLDVPQDGDPRAARDPGTERHPPCAPIIETSDRTFLSSSTEDSMHGKVLGPAYARRIVSGHLDPLAAAGRLVTPVLFVDSSALGSGSALVCMEHDPAAIRLHVIAERLPWRAPRVTEPEWDRLQRLKDEGNAMFRAAGRPLEYMAAVRAYSYVLAPLLAGDVLLFGGHCCAATERLAVEALSNRALAALSIATPPALKLADADLARARSSAWLNSNLEEAARALRPKVEVRSREVKQKMAELQVPGGPEVVMGPTSARGAGEEGPVHMLYTDSCSGYMFHFILQGSDAAWRSVMPAGEYDDMGRQRMCVEAINVLFYVHPHMQGVPGHPQVTDFRAITLEGEVQGPIIIEGDVQSPFYQTCIRIPHYPNPAYQPDIRTESAVIPPPIFKRREARGEPCMIPGVEIRVIPETALARHVIAVSGQPLMPGVDPIGVSMFQVVVQPSACSRIAEMQVEVDLARIRHQQGWADRAPRPREPSAPPGAPPVPDAGQQPTGGAGPYWQGELMPPPTALAHRPSALVTPESASALQERIRRVGLAELLDMDLDGEEAIFGGGGHAGTGTDAAGTGASAGGRGSNRQGAGYRSRGRGRGRGGNNRRRGLHRGPRREHAHDDDENDPSVHANQAEETGGAPNFGEGLKRDLGSAAPEGCMSVYCSVCFCGDPEAEDPDLRLWQDPVLVCSNNHAMCRGCAGLWKENQRKNASSHSYHLPEVTCPTCRSPFIAY